jgi:AcrR family transcriptional regulator
MTEMASRQEQRSEETKRSIVAAARELFSSKGYELVTMREIAKAAQCSHTTIYIYFKDKESLLQELSMPPLKELQQQMEKVFGRSELTPESRLRMVSLMFIRFCLGNRNMYHLFFQVKAERVDVKEPELEINRVRNALFEFLSRGLQQCLQLSTEDSRLLAYSRIYFFTLHGIVGTYSASEETLEALLERLGDTFTEAVDVLLSGFKHQMKTGERLS